MSEESIEEDPRSGGYEKEKLKSVENVILEHNLRLECELIPYTLLFMTVLTF